MCCTRALDISNTLIEQLPICGTVSLSKSRLAMGIPMLQAVNRRMKGLHLKKEPEAAPLNEHLWALVLQHLDTLQDHVMASTSCKAAWQAGLLKWDIPEHLPPEGMR